MTGRTDIMNLALVSFLGSDHLMDRDEQDKNTRVMNLIYNPLLEKLQREYAWNFCARSVQLTPLNKTPVIDYQYAYQLPVDLMVLVSVGDMYYGHDFTEYDPRLVTAEYRIEGRELLTNLPPPLSLRYRARVTDASKFDSTFVDALACMLAIRSCKAVTGKDTLKSSLLDEFQMIISGAVRANAIEKPSEKFPPSTWMEARL
ncbi:hypothetical protein DEO55_13145 [Klebsiella pneumoniae]|nr:hypothetical protein DEO52_15235 [Klebsiella pneumoniae]AWJ24378.1 hypothetical protein DEO55_13145 [Klebsiella pneumoniae]MUA49522.1 hypothetical protein [Klebsiella pneumoniae]OZK48675.1 hypothetical protein CEO80_04220 [Klebsiella pneumoniae]OZL60624.1 hypothetical protein CEO60_04020 [Klebsiella pneumoniae]